MFGMIESTQDTKKVRGKPHFSPSTLQTPWRNCMTGLNQRRQCKVRKAEVIVAFCSRMLVGAIGTRTNDPTGSKVVLLKSSARSYAPTTIG